MLIHSGPIRKTRLRRCLLTILAVAWLLLPSATSSGQNFNLSTDEDGPNDCSSLKVQFNNRPAARAEQSLTIATSQSFIRMTAPRHGGIRVRGVTRSDILVRVCKAVPAEGQGSGSAQLERIVGTVTGTAVTVTGPAHNRWVAFPLLVDAPDGAMLDLEATNGPLDIRDFRGLARATTTNGPIGLANVAGEVTARAQNGPIGLKGRTGKIDLDTQNGPIQVRLAGTRWDGGGLDREGAGRAGGRGGSAWLPVWRPDRVRRTLPVVLQTRGVQRGTADVGRAR